MKVELRTEPFDPWKVLAEYQSAAPIAAGSYGATAAFVGTMRDFNQGDVVSSMRLEHYPGMTERELQKLAADAKAEHRLLDALIVHRVGLVQPNDSIVLLAAWSVHRAEAFRACREMMSVLKSKAPLWKKEVLAESERWVTRNSPD